MNELLLKEAREMRDLLRTREISTAELLTAHIEHIQRVNPSLNAIVTECFEAAMAQAKKLDATGEHTSLLSGLPIAHKDLVSTKNLRTTFGSTLYRDHIPSRNDYIVDRIQQAGAITIGKTNVPEFGAGSHTFNRVFGPTRNPYDVDRTCGGSSGGAAVALATRMTAIADGSDLGGSLRNPAAFCNVIGFRPTNNVLPPLLDVDRTRNLASLGPMARTIDDIALLFEALVNDVADPYSPRVSPTPLRDLRIAFTEDFGNLPIEPSIKQLIRHVAACLEEAGAKVEEATPNLAEARDIFQVLRGVSFRNRHDALTPRQKTELKPTILWNLAVGLAVTNQDLNRIKTQRAQLQHRTAAFFQDYDLLIGPTTQVLPFPIAVEWIREIEGVQMDTYIDWMESCSWITTTECPALSMPAGFINGLPVGIQLIAKRDADKELLRMSKSVETLISSACTIPDL